ncbi:cysteine--tRNA ligase [Crocosphaera watsonii WH 8501]|uniref:Cysteine--tRNA ligase n=2 Tax=Crocosphaera watsonii TaxID=263511 RepID=Q4C4U0_CROWT|nr:cysteine--tRNA ligase [Crocosphaera watsonii]EAM51157.1 Cysteinyl-tRNA synthetase, class Ia [Crocosphaera watsonii WH 8501]
MTLKIYNTQTRRLEPFVTLLPGRVTMYCCGVTVYDYCHLGHARSYIIWDMVRRYLKWRGYEVTYVQNFTDIDDKILRRAQEQGVSMADISERFIEAYFEDIRPLNVMDADEYPRVTDNISGIQQLIEVLLEKNYAYAADGDVYFHVEAFEQYGKLSGRSQSMMQAGASGRVAVSDPTNSHKKHPSDFALWKSAKPEEPAWDSPWGEGRPGWHIECSAMVRGLLGETIDIHGGGGDLVFPHHENEIAQSEAANGKPLAKYWVHNGMVTVNGEKMSKSLGNFTTIRELLNRPLEPMVIRLFVLQAHYRKPLDFTEEAISSATNGWQTLQQGLLFGEKYGNRLGWEKNQELDSAVIEQFKATVDDDFNSPGGLAVLFELAKNLRREGNLLTHEGKITTDGEDLQRQWQTLVHLAGILGLEAKSEVGSEDTNNFDQAEITKLIQQRNAARKVKDYAESDRIREQLQEMGITLIDQPNGETSIVYSS